MSDRKATKSNKMVTKQGAVPLPKPFSRFVYREGRGLEAAAGREKCPGSGEKFYLLFGLVDRSPCGLSEIRYNRVNAVEGVLGHRFRRRAKSACR